MKLTSKLLFGLVFISVHSFQAQSKVVYGLTKDYTKRHININGDDPFVYSVEYNTVKTKKQTTIKNVSPEYIELENRIADYHNHYEEIQQQYQLDIEKYNNIKLAQDNIREFISSQQPIESARDILKESQNILTDYGIDELVYADSETNVDYETKFSILSSNHTDLKLHLREVSLNLKDLNIEPKAVLDDDSISELTAQLDNMSLYVTEKGKDRIVKHTQIELGAKIKHIPSELAGDFVIVDNYTLITKDYNSTLKKGCLVKYDVAKKQELVEKGYAKKTSKRMIQNVHSKKKYIVDYNFLKNYAYTFNGKFRYQAKNLISSL